MNNHIGEVQRVVVCAANKHDDNTILIGVRHGDWYMRVQYDNIEDHIPSHQWVQGFVDQYGVFMNRYEALEVATKAGQINTRRSKTAPEDQLFSEDLY